MWRRRKTPKTEPNASVLLDSISPAGVRLTTMVVTFHRFVLAEFNTHRVFSRNSASSRAIPVKKQLERVRRDPAIPLVWAAEQKGMQGGAELSAWRRFVARRLWLAARTLVVGVVMVLVKLRVHKSITNRLLEPWLWHTVIVSSTSWDGFWDQRISPLAQPEIKAAAEAMKAAFDASTPRRLTYGEWHMPLIRPDDMEDVIRTCGLGGRLLEALKRISCARCARVSFLTHDGIRSIEADLELYGRLTSADPMHASPLEHVATPARPDDTPLGNLRGWIQLRHCLSSD